MKRLSPLPRADRRLLQGASAETVDACRVEPDPHGLEDRLVARLGEEETLIAFAVAGM